MFELKCQRQKQILQNVEDKNQFLLRAFQVKTTGVADAPPPPHLPGIQNFSISWSFRENLVKLYVGAPAHLQNWHPLLGEILDPPLNWNEMLGCHINQKKASREST